MLKVRVGRGFADVRRRGDNAICEAREQAAEPLVKEEVTAATESELVPTRPSTYTGWQRYEHVG